MEIPKHIIKKAAQAEAHAKKAHALISDIEKWMSNQGIDWRTAREQYIFDECGGIGHTINIDALQKYLNNH